MILKKGNQVKIITGKDKGKTGEILEINRKLNKVKVDSYKQAVNLLKMNRIDGIVGSKIGLEYTLRQQNTDNSLATNAFTLGRRELGLHLSKNSPYITLLPLLTTAVERLYQEEFLYQIYQYQINYCLPLVKN